MFGRLLHFDAVSSTRPPWFCLILIALLLWICRGQPLFYSSLSILVALRDSKRVCSEWIFFVARTHAVCG